MDIMRKQQIKINKKNWEKGEKVLVKKMENIKKFGDRYEGPFTIVDIQHPNLLISDSGLADEAWLVHMDRCKPFYSEEILNEKDKKTNQTVFETALIIVYNIPRRIVPDQYTIRYNTINFCGVIIF